MSSFHRRIARSVGISQSYFRCIVALQSRWGQGLLRPLPTAKRQRWAETDRITSAAILGAALNASVIEILTDVDGVLSADPRDVPSAFVLPEVSYEEAMELSYFGAKVLHSATISPAVARGIPILIKNTFRPDKPGTIISRSAGRRGQLVKGITAVAGVTLLTLRGLSMVGVPGIAERLFRAVASRGVNIILIS